MRPPRIPPSLLLRHLLPIALLAAPIANACAQSSTSLSGTDGDRWLLQTSVFTRHFSPDERHVNHQRLVDLEYWRSDGWLVGGAWFRNSFGQSTQYVFGGRLWRPFDRQPEAYLKLTGGLIHGYKGEFRDKIPFNQSGIAPAIIPSIGWSTRRFNSEFVLFGTSGVMITFGAFLN